MPGGGGGGAPALHPGGGGGGIEAIPCLQAAEGDYCDEGKGKDESYCPSRESALVEFLPFTNHADSSTLCFWPREQA